MPVLGSAESKPAENVDEYGDCCGGWIEITTRNLKAKYCINVSHVWIIGIIGFLLTFWIGFSRMVRGQHTYNQILLGWVWGINVSFIFWFNQKTIMDWIKRTEDWSKKKVLIVFMSAIAGTIGSTCIIYGIFRIAWKKHKGFQPWIETKCDRCYGSLITNVINNQCLTLFPFVMNFIWLLIPRLDQVLARNMNNFRERGPLTWCGSIGRWVIYVLAL